MRSRWGSAAYYAFFDSSFQREQQAFLLGKERFDADRYSPSESSSLLRRNAHRIEKGLISRPRRSVFARDYIDETVSVYKHLVSSENSLGIEEISWAHDVLSQYFDVVSGDAKVERLREEFLALPKPCGAPLAARNEKRVPYPKSVGPPPVDYDALLRLSEERRSVRWFLDQRVPRELLLKAAKIATQSPSACNRQPFQFRVFDDRKLLGEIARLPAGTVGFEHNFPCVIVVVGRQRYYSEERDRHLIYIDGSLATMSFILALETLGLASCCINWPDIEERERQADRLLRLAPDERPIMFIAVGYPDPDGLVPYSEKLPPDRLCRFNFE